MNGSVISIAIASDVGRPTMTVPDVRAVPGRGLEGDRYFNRACASNVATPPAEQITLIETENLEEFNRQYGTAFTAADTRRNIATRGIRLNDLEGHDFMVGEVRLRGLELCEPCSYLVSLTVPEVLKGLLHKAGLRAEILSEGVIRQGDSIGPVGDGDHR